jgi:hypothetical protein
MPFSAGDCKGACGELGVALLALPVEGGRIFYFCDSCGVAWGLPLQDPLTYYDPPERFAPVGFRLATLDDIRFEGIDPSPFEEVPDDRIADWAQDGHSPTLPPFYRKP